MIELKDCPFRVVIMIIDQKTYKKAFQAYLRKGTPIMWSIKQERPTTHYIWRTRRDGKVRPRHAEREGQIFAWDNPPPGGHPGEDYNCRCTAEPYIPDVDEYLSISLSDVSDSGSGWRSRDFVEHYFAGRGRGVTVRQTGHLRAIVDQYMNIVEDRLKGQIADRARSHGPGSFSDVFGRPYQMQGVVFSIGDTTIGGQYTGQATDQHGILRISGSLEFYLRDEFADPIDIGVEVDDYRPGSIIHDTGHGLQDIAEGIGDAVDGLGRTLIDNVHMPLEDYIRGRAGLKAQTYKIIQQTSTKDTRTGRDGVPYAITDNWSGRFEGVVYFDRNRSTIKFNG